MIKSDKWIRQQCDKPLPMIEPFAPSQVRFTQRPDPDPRAFEGVIHERIISYGTSSYGYDIRCADEFKVFTNINSTVVDPKNFDERSFVEVSGQGYCIIPPNSFALARTVEYFRIPRDVLTICLGKSTYARCFSGDTEVALANGTSVSFRDMVKRAKTGERFFGYGISKKLGVVVTELVAPRCIARDEDLVRVYLDDGSKIDCTPDHLFLTRSGKYVQAQNLDSGDSLMPLYRYRTKQGREFVYDPVMHDAQSDTGGVYRSRHYKLTYWLADAFNLRSGRYSVSKGDSRHHKDHDVANDYPTNITRLPRSVHQSHHAKDHNATYWTEENRLKSSRSIRLALRELRKDPEWHTRFIEQQRLRSRDFWDNPEYADARASRNAKVKRALNTKEWKDAQSKRVRAFYDSERGRLAMATRVSPKRIKLSKTRVELALTSTGSLRGAAALLGVSARPIRERFPNLLARLKRCGILQSGDRVTLSLKEAERALRKCGSINAASKLLGISGPTLTREASPILDKLRRQGVIPQSNHKVDRVVRLKTPQDVYCLTSPGTGNFALEAGVFVKNCGIVVNVTPFEPEWEGYVTLEFSNTTPLPAKIYAGEGCAQVLFFQSDEVCETSYKDRHGKYQNQTGVVPPRM